MTTPDCPHAELDEHPVGLACRACGEVIDRARAKTVAETRAEARRATQLAGVARSRRALRHEPEPEGGDR